MCAMIGKLRRRSWGMVTGPECSRANGQPRSRRPGGEPRVPVVPVRALVPGVDGSQGPPSVGRSTPVARSTHDEPTANRGSPGDWRLDALQDARIALGPLPPPASPAPLRRRASGVDDDVMNSKWPWD